MSATNLARQSIASGATARSMCRAAFTLPEILVVLFVVAILLGMAISRIGSAADRAAVHAAVMEAAAIFGLARNEAVYRRASVAVSIDTTKGTLVVSRESTVVVRRDLSGSYGVRISTSRDSIAFDARGLGVGIANLSLIARRGHAADTAFLSRLGRVRY